jgi:hypothetical protein
MGEGGVDVETSLVIAISMAGGIRRVPQEKGACL